MPGAVGHCGLCDGINSLRCLRCVQGLGRSAVTMVHCWGSAKNGRLGTGLLLDSSSFPELVPDLDGEPIVDLTCGLDHTLVLARLL